MSCGEVMRFYSASRIIQSENQLAKIQSSSFHTFKKSTRETIVTKLKSIRRVLFTGSNKPVTMDQVLKHLRKNGNG